VDRLLQAILALLVNDMPLRENYRDHALVGNWNEYRECHLKPDLLLVYKTEEPEILKIARLDSHSEIFNR
jgi:mRNA interferase YafQ